MPEYKEQIEEPIDHNGAFGEIPDNEQPSPESKEKVTTSLNMVRGIFSSVEGVFDMFASIFKGFFK